MYRTAIHVFYCAANKNIKLLKKLLKFDRKYAIYTTYGAAYGGHLRVLQWARQNGCGWNSLTCSLAALNGHLAVLHGYVKMVVIGIH